MGDFLQRQADILSAAIVNFEASRISLGALIHRLDEVRSIIDNQGFKDRLRKIAVSLEQINAAVLEGEALSSTSEEIIQVGVEQLKEAISALQRD
jgi:hypothetical protein